MQRSQAIKNELKRHLQRKAVFSGLTEFFNLFKNSMKVKLTVKNPSLDRLFSENDIILVGLLGARKRRQHL